MPTYGAFHIWNHGRDKLSTDGHESPESAQDSIVRMLRADGWTLPKWWHFWRWDESIPDWLRERYNGKGKV